MQLKNNSLNWGSISISLHWLTFLLILGLAVVGLIMTDLPNNPLKIQIYTLHKSFGLTVLGLTVIRLVWRFFSAVPATLANTPAWQVMSAKFTHIAIYALLVAIPISGWVFTSAANFPLKYFGLFKLPKLSGPNPALKHLAGEMHEIFFYTLVVLVFLHAGAALKNHYFDKDNVLTRMLPWLGEKS